MMQYFYRVQGKETFIYMFETHLLSENDFHHELMKMQYFQAKGDKVRQTTFLRTDFRGGGYPPDSISRLFETAFPSQSSNLQSSIKIDLVISRHQFPLKFLPVSVISNHYAGLHIDVSVKLFCTYF